ncbi:hypothetical protein BIW11_08104 [Tropilaelaps mercedesae]|uniref:Uncharacterized protein n=1 Tax=Tropilaelaps mercedesae TaxID=418985 RepID=A0A1V9XR08_9ACAR|nr:hypothetical protein BIW11_08104 [Tropilaelaps mercedesae]
MIKTLSKEFHALFRPPPAASERRKDARGRLSKSPKGLAEVRLSVDVKRKQTN